MLRRQFFDDLIVRKQGSQYRNMTFRQHYELFKIELVLTGSQPGKVPASFSAINHSEPAGSRRRQDLDEPAFLFKPYRIGSICSGSSTSAQEEKSS